MGNIDERTKQDFLIYANSVIKSRAIPAAEDNLKPIHRRILWSMYDSKFFSNKPTVKSAKVIGNVMGSLHPHGDSSIYEALVRMSQWWKLRYPLVELQGNGGNLLGDPAAASRYTETRLSPIGMLMLEDINKNCVDFRPNYDNSTTEPITLPSKFPYLLCGNNSGIAVGMGSDLVSHNFTEVSEAIEFFMHNKDCTIADLMQFIKGPDFPTGGQIMNGEDLLNIYTTGTGSVKVRAHYDITKKGAKTLIVFHDLPYGVDIDNGVKAPLKKMVLEDGFDVFEDVSVVKAGPRNFDITVTLGKGADVSKCLDLLFSKTKLESSIKINQNLIVNGEPRTFNLKEMIVYWVDYRSSCIKRVASTDYDKTNHKLTVVLGLQKCLSDIDLLINLIRNSDSRADAKVKIIKAFTLTDEQAEAVLDIKLSRLSRLDLEALNDDQKELNETLAKLKNIIDNESVRYDIILKDLADIKKNVLSKDERLTEITYTKPSITADKPLIKREYFILSNGVIDSSNLDNVNDPLNVVFAYDASEILGYTKTGEVGPINLSKDCIGGFVRSNKEKIVSVTKNGNIKVSFASEYKLTRANEKAIKLKEGDELVYMQPCSDEDFLLLLGDDGRVLKLAVSSLSVTGKLTMGVRSGFSSIKSAVVANNSENLLFVTQDLKGKYTPVQSFNTDERGNKGQAVAENTIVMRLFDNSRTSVYCVPERGKIFAVDRSKLSIKGKTAVGAAISSRAVSLII